MSSSSSLQKRRQQEQLPNQDTLDPPIEEASELALDPSSFSHSRSLFFSLACLRILNSLLLSTFFSPDEYWQALEPAHVAVFGYGGLTWEWKEKIRSFAHPLIYATSFYFLKLLGLDDSDLLVIVPKILNGLIAATGDYYTFQLAKKLFGAGPARWALFCSLISWFNFYCLPRSFSNTLETVLITIGLFYWPWKTLPNSTRHYQDAQVSTIMAAISFVIRPTSAIIWAPLFLHYFWLHRHAPRHLLGQLLPLPLLVLLVALGVDRVFYGEFVIPWWNFFRLNVGKGIGEFYGRHPWHWYLSQGLPVLLFSFLPLFLLSLPLSLSLSRPRAPGFLGLWTVAFYSLLGHKEFRFLFPLLPLALAHVGLYLYSLAPIIPFKLFRLFGARSPSHQTILKKGKEGGAWLQGMLVVGLLVTQLPLAFYASLVHQRGVIDVMAHLRQQPAAELTSVFFLMPCHSTPYQAYLHRPIPLFYLSCLPPLNNEDLRTYQDESDVFYRDPQGFVRSLVSRQEPPSHVVLFEALEPQVGGILSEKGYRRVKAFFNSHWIDDPRRQGDVIVWQIRL